MGKIEAIYEKLEENRIKAFQSSGILFSDVSKQDWNATLMSQISTFNDIYASNTALLQELEDILAADLCLEEIEELYEASMAYYAKANTEYRYLLPVFERLVAIYEKENNFNRLPILYMAINFEVNYIKAPQIYQFEYDTCYAIKTLSLKSYYTQMEPSARLAIFQGYRTRCINELKAGLSTVQDVFSMYDEMVSFWKSETVQRLDLENDEIKEVISRTNYDLSRLLNLIGKGDEKTRNWFFEITRGNYVYSLQKNISKYDMQPYVYASYLYYLDETTNRGRDQSFSELVNIFQYWVSEYEKKTNILMDEIMKLQDFVSIFNVWAENGLPLEKCNLIATHFYAFTETNWIFADFNIIPKLSALIKEMCIFISKYSSIKMDIEECIYQTVIMRNFYTYISTNQIMNLSKIVFEESYEMMPSLYANYEGMAYEELEEFVVNCAKLHEIGVVDMVRYLFHNMYPPSEEENISYLQHPIIAGKFMEKYDSLRKYRDVAMGHHKYYDGSGGYPENYDNTIAFHRIITDIVFLANQVNTLFDPYVQKGCNFTFEQILEELHKGAGTKYNPMLVSVIESSSQLRARMERALTQDKTNLIYSFHHNMDNFLQHKNIQGFLREVYDKFNEVKKTKQIDEFLPLIDRLFEYAARDHSDEIYGWAYYYSMLYHQEKEEYMNAINCGTEAIRYLEKTDKLEYLSRTHVNLGIILQSQGNLEGSIGHFLQGIEYADLARDELFKAVAYNNLANIFKRLGIYEKANQYFDRAEELAKGQKSYEIAFVFNQLYCYIQSDNKEKVNELYERLQQLKKELKPNQDYPQFCMNLYEACYGEYIGDNELLNSNLEQISKDVSILQDFGLHYDEISAYLSILVKLDRREELTAQLDRYIDFCHKKKIVHHLLENLLNMRIKYALMDKDYARAKELIQSMKDLKAEELYNQADLVHQLEDNLVKDMKRQHTRRDLLEQNKELQRKVLYEKQAGDAKTAFLSSMSHEIRTPIHAVIGLNEMILREAKDENIKQYAKDIEAAGKNLLGIVNDVLDFSKMEAGKTEIIPEEYRLSDLLKKIYESFSGAARDKNLSFQIVCEKQLPDKLYGDDQRIIQILQNLISNAVKFTKEGSVTLKVSGMKRNEKLVQLYFSVKDTGIGIKAEEIDKLMKPFERADENRNYSISGTGLGISIVGMLVNKMNGSISIDSEYGKGSEFGVKLNQEVLSWDNMKPLSFESEKKKTLFAPKASILVVDDNAVNLKVVTALLKRTGVMVSTATSGKATLEMTKDIHYDLILLDHQMPGMDGIETLKHLKEQAGANEETAVIALTANSDSGALEFYVGKGFTDYIPKPVDYHVMEEKIAKYLPKELIQ